MNLTGQFLIAMPAMSDPCFSKTVTYICTHNADGAMGITINRTADISIRDLLSQMKLETTSAPLLRKSVHYGGPVQIDRGFILHEPQLDLKIEYDSTVIVNGAIAMTTSKDILAASAEGKGPQNLLIALGYAGWTAGQLEQEVLQNAWLSLETSDTQQIHKLIFDMANADKFDYAMSLMGLNLANLSHSAGHA
jgi:putative transcriptional regulator